MASVRIPPPHKKKNTSVLTYFFLELPANLCHLCFVLLLPGRWLEETLINPSAKEINLGKTKHTLQTKNAVANILEKLWSSQKVIFHFGGLACFDFLHLTAFWTPFFLGNFWKKGMLFFGGRGRILTQHLAWYQSPKGSLNGCWNNFQGASDTAGKAVLERIFCAPAVRKHNRTANICRYYLVMSKNIAWKRNSRKGQSYLVGSDRH